MNREQWRQRLIDSTASRKEAERVKRNARAREIRKLTKEGKYKPKPRHTDRDYRLCRHPACRARFIRETQAYYKEHPVPTDKIDASKSVNMDDIPF